MGSPEIMQHIVANSKYPIKRTKKNYFGSMKYLSRLFSNQLLTSFRRSFHSRRMKSEKREADSRRRRV